MQQKFSNILKIISLLLLSFSCKAQKFEWVNFVQGKSSQEAVSMCADSFGNQYSSFNYFEEITFGGITLKDSVNSQNVLILKQNTYGKILWYCNIRTLTSNSWVRALASSFNGRGNLITFVVSPVDILAGKDTIKRKGTTYYAVYVLEFDKNGKLVSGRNIIEGQMNANNDNIYDAPKRFVTDPQDNIYFSLWYKGQINIYDSTGVTNYGSSSAPYRNIIFKFSKSGHKFEWVTELPIDLISGAGGIYINSLKVDIHQNLYAAAYWAASIAPVTFKGKTLNNPQTGIGMIFTWDKNGKDKNWFYIPASGKKSTIADLAVHDSNSVFISGSYLGDSAKFDTVWKRNSKYGVYQFFARYNSNGKLKWVKTEDSSYTNFLSYWNRYASMINYKDEYFYRSYFENAGSSSKPIIWDGQKYVPADKLSQGMNLKFDNRGNILWGFRTPMPFNSMATDDNNNFYFQGRWGYDSIRFGNFKAYSNGGDSYIGKTFDYAIFRGNINKGPYCAGDSFYVPYTKGGVFADTNIFIAEISDEFGNFTGKERELGRIKSKNDGKIRGVLPMFQIASSGQYRIRIRSTSPQAQSFYKADTLRLLIYSRDKANPGPPEWICKGDTIPLNTYGGTKWKWSPKYRMDDSTLRQPLVWPMKDTIYKIIISDSSGCGAPDTAYKKIYIRDELKAIAAFKDTGVCKNISLKIPVHFTGGDSNYHWKWYALTFSKWWLAIGEGKWKQDDTLLYTTTMDSINTFENVILVLWDECSSKHDTVFINMTLRKPLYLTSQFKDTTICQGTTIGWTAKTNSIPGTYQYQWKDLTTNTVVSTYDFLKLKPTQTTKLKLSLIGWCSEDTSVFTVTVKPPLKAATNLKDTTICYGQTINYTAKATGGDSTNYLFSWVLDKKEISTSNTLQLSINHYSNLSNPILTLIIKDNCSIPNDSLTKKITIKPSPKADFSYDLACSRTITNFKFTGTKPQSPITTAFNWNFNNESNSSLENPSKLFSTSGIKTITISITSSNGCTDTFTKNIVVKAQSTADFTASDVCESDSVIFVNKSKDATGYTWKFGDGKTSNKQGPKHKYQITSSTTFNVSLVAIVSGGCSDSIGKAVTINQNPNSDFSSTQNVNKLDLKAKAGYSKYQWKIENKDSIATTISNYTYTLKSYTPHKVCLTVTDAIGCTAQTCKTIILGISNVSKQQGFKLYPNPNSGNFTIEIENPVKDCLLEVYNSLGEVVERVEGVGKVNVLNLGVAAGIYFVRVKNGVAVWTEKVSVDGYANR